MESLLIIILEDIYHGGNDVAGWCDVCVVADYIMTLLVLLFLL